MEINSIQNQSVTGRNKPTEELSAKQQTKNEQNQAILQASLEVSISSGNDSMELLFRTAVNELNKVLETDLGSSPIQKAYDSGLDISPGATAERIVSLSANFFSSYQNQHPEMDYQTQVESFVEVISGGIDQGFAEARNILDGLDVLEGDIATNIDTTYTKVQEKLVTLMDTLMNADPAKTADSAE